jgi:hypothetical protein
VRADAVLYSIIILASDIALVHALIETGIADLVSAQYVVHARDSSIRSVIITKIIKVIITSAIQRAGFAVATAEDLVQGIVAAVTLLLIDNSRAADTDAELPVERMPGPLAVAIGLIELLARVQ